MTTIRHQRFTIYDDDDVTPILGSPTCTTDPAGTRPYLKRLLDISTTEVDFINGSSTIGQINVEILDKRTNASDQTTGWFTAILGSGGVNVLGGHRCKFEQQDDTGTWRTVINGVIGDIELQDNKTTYRLAVRDIRERERDMSIFNTLGGASTVLPLGGVISGWGKINTANYVIKPVVPIRATFVIEPGTSGKVGMAMFANRVINSLQQWRGGYASNYLVDICGFDLVNPTHAGTDYDSVFTGASVSKIQLWWRAHGTADPWTKIIRVPYIPGSEWLVAGGASLWKEWITRHGTSFSYQGSNTGNVQAVAFASNDTLLMPANGQDIDMMVVGYGIVPSDTDPLYIECTYGQLLKDIYDGVYSADGAPLLDYDTAAMADLVTNTPIARLRITSPVDDARSWAEENIYKILGAAPSFNSDGQIKPIFYKLPDASETFVQLDDTNIVSGSGKWQHSQSAAVTKVVFNYILSRLLRDKNNTYTVVERDEQYVEIDAYASVIGMQAVEFSPDSVRSLLDITGAAANAAMNVGDFIDDTGGKLSRARAHDLLMRFSHGPQILSLDCIISDSAVTGIENGDWVIVASSWMPDYSTGTRGINRIFQVIGVQETSSSKRTFKLLDGGPYTIPLAQPTITSVGWEDGTGAVKVDITVPASTIAVMQTAISATTPDSNSGLWHFAGKLDATGSLRVFDTPTGKTLWVRARSEGQGKISSAWTTPTSIAITSVPTITDTSLVLRDGSPPIVSWTPSADCLGIRVQYVVFEAGDSMPTSSYTTFADYISADLEEVLTGLEVLQYQNVAIRLIAYPGFSAGSVTGAAGASIILTGQRMSETFVGPTVNETLSSDGTTGTLQITPLLDPQYRIKKYEFRHRSSSDGAWSAWVEDTVASYEDNVTLSVTDISQIEYRVTIIDHNNDQVVWCGNVVSFPRADGGVARNECKAQVTSVTATTVTVTVTGSSSLGTATVHLVSITGSATLSSGPAVGATGQPSGTAWVFNRGAFGIGVGQVQFRSTSSSGLEPTDDDFVDIPEVGRDTIFLSTRARVTATTATTVTVRVAVVDPYPQGANSATITYSYQISTGAGSCSPASGQTCTPASTFTEAAGTYVDFTVTRPAFGTGTGRVTFTTTAANRVSDSDAVDIPAVEQTTFGPSLEVTPTPHTTTYDIAYTYDGTITYSIDGGSFSTPPSSPITGITRNAAGGNDKTYTFKCMKDGQTITSVVTVPAQSSSGSGTDFITVNSPYNTYAPNDGGGNFDVSWSTSGLTGAETFNITWHCADGYYSSPDGSQSSVTSGDTISFALASAPTDGYLVVRAYLGSDLIATGIYNGGWA